MTTERSTTIWASIAQASTPDHLDVRRDVVVTVDPSGTISSIVDRQDHGDGGIDHQLGRETWLLPGLVDLHLHAPQWPQLGTGLDLPLERWLNERTFPLEARCADPAFAGEVWDHMVPALLAEGTTTAVYYGSIHTEATTALAEACARFGQRAFVGRVAMDHPATTPEWYRDESAAASIAESARSIREIRALDNPLVAPIVTPRFVPACSDDALSGLADLAAETDTLVQTHCSESDWQHGAVVERTGLADTQALDRWGLLREGTVLAHAGFVSDDDLETIRLRKAGIAHCPLSNAYFGDAVFPLERALRSGARVGLGTDVAGGPEASVMRNAAMAVTSSRMLESGVDPDLDRARRTTGHRRIGAVTALWLATRGGAEVVGLPVGLLEPGRPFDAIAVRLDGPTTVWPDDDADGIVKKIVRSVDGDRIVATWVQGRRVSGHR